MVRACSQAAAPPLPPYSPQAVPGGEQGTGQQLPRSHLLQLRWNPLAQAAVGGVRNAGPELLLHPGDHRTRGSLEGLELVALWLATLPHGGMLLLLTSTLSL